MHSVMPFKVVAFICYIVKMGDLCKFVLCIHMYSITMNRILLK